jgi:NTE family protein
VSNGAATDSPEGTRAVRTAKWPDKIALCLSGGGYRAALFHLGAIRRLNELGLLARVDTISSVSGGSILSAHLANALFDWPCQALDPDEFHKRVAAPFEAFCCANIRTRPVLTRLLPQNWLRTDTGVRELAKIYARTLCDKTLGDIAGGNRPRFVFCATDLAFGVNWTYDTGGHQSGHGVRMGDYQVGYSNAADVPVALAVAASSCFPPVFDPFDPHLQPADYTGGLARRELTDKERDRYVAGVTLSDGGVYDNLGSQPVLNSHGSLIVSDGGAVFEPIGPIGRFAIVKRLKRYSSIAQRGGGAMRRSHIITLYENMERSGTLWSVGTRPSSYSVRDNRCYPDALVRDRIETIRTDLDAFTDAEQAILQNHGYLIADAAARTHLSTYPDLLVGPIGEAHPPYPVWLDATGAEKALASSAQRRLLRSRR